MINKINIRVYGLYLNPNKELLALHEYYAGEQLIKLPGGGLELGEGLIDCLHREFMEELNLKIEIKNHFYTQEDFIVSKFRENEQLLTIYYLIDIPNIEELKIMDKSIQEIKWISLQEENPLPLPIDQLVFQKLKNEFS